MSIRRTLLVAFVGVGLVSAALLAGLAFVKARQAVQTEIERSLGVQATGTADEIDKMMFERLQNAATWSHLDIMQDLQVRDVDKRLSRFLADLQTGYGDVYLVLSCTDMQGRVISSSDAGLVGSSAPAPAESLSAPLSGTLVGLEPPKAIAGDPGRAPGAVVADMHVPVRSAFRDAAIGSLRLRLDWSRIEEVLDQAAGGDGRMVAVLDAQGRIVAASAELRRRRLPKDRSLADWRTAPARVSVRPGAPLDDSDVIVGMARSRGYERFAGFGWTTLVVQPIDQAFAPIHRMALIFLGLFVLILAGTVLTATWVSQRIAAPIAALTRYARGYTRDKAFGAPPDAGSGEVGELTTSFVSMVRDIAESQQRLVRASKLAVVGEMSAVIAHEVRTPLGILRSSAQMLQRESGISAEGRELVGFIESETERLNRLVSAMLDTARPRRAVHRDVDVHALIHQTVAMLAAQVDRKQVGVTEQLRASDATIQCDREQIMQVLLNILMNGLQILHHGGRIQVSTADAGPRLAIEIADDGPGIEPAERAKVFEAFFFQREGGIGLGLAIVQQIVLDHGGDIEAGASPLGGALFRIVLPRTPPGAT